MNYSNCQFTWLKQRETLVSLAESLLKDETYFDCQLCAEGRHFNVHRVILSCNSPVLSNILQEHNSDLPVITLEGVSPIEVAALVEFMYTGVTKLSPAYLRNFFQIARSLQLAGLTHYDNAQVNRIVHETGSPAIDTEFQDNYEAYSQNILRYLDQSESSMDSNSKELTSLNASVGSMFLGEPAEESSNVVDASTVIYEKYESDLIKEDDGLEPIHPNVESDNLSQMSDAVDANTGEASETDTSLMYNKFHRVFIKSEDYSINDGITTVYSISKLDDFSGKEDNESGKIEDEFKVNEEDENFIYVKLNDSSLSRMKDGQSSFKGKQNSSKNDVRLYTEKCLKVINPVEKSYLVKRPKMQNLLKKDLRTNSEDKKIYICLKCGNKYSHRRTLLHHIHWICEQPATYSCSLCPYRGKRKFQLKSHMKHAHLLKFS